ncbi:MAG TPA: type II and III secretion system protein family protein [Pyrinomonadaceae bacterium]|nr:type II and III secretion system protein family protein [Pyrinomonadaceae bacterium]
MLKNSCAARLAVALCATFLLFAQAEARQNSVGASFETNGKEPVQINVLVGQSRVINFDRPIGRFSVSDPAVAEAVLVAPDQVLVNGRAFGQVNFIAWEQQGEKFVVFDVFVRANLSLIDSQIRALFPKDDIRLSQANGSVVISGSVKDPKTAGQVEAVVKAAGFNAVNMLESPVAEKLQVQLQVRVAEVSRSKLREIGTSYGYTQNGTVSYLNSGQGPSSLKEVALSPMSVISNYALSPALNLFLGNGDAGLSGMLRALKSTGAIRSLAEPNLIAMDGQEASFLAGGEFPVPIVQSNGERTSVAIVFKEYGVRLNFKPTIIDEDHIRLELEPEVSTIDFANGVKFEGFLIPALKTRRAKTGVELRDGQSFALAGLIDNNEIQSFSKVPGIGDIPLIGNLFKSKSFQKQETELMFIVTAHMVKPVNRDDLPQTRGLDGLKQNSPLGIEPKGEGIDGTHGYSTGGATTSEAKPAAKPAANPEAKPAGPDKPAPAAKPEKAEKAEAAAAASTSQGEKQEEAQKAEKAETAEEAAQRAALAVGSPAVKPAP